MAATYFLLSKNVVDSSMVSNDRFKVQYWQTTRDVATERLKAMPYLTFHHRTSPTISVLDCDDLHAGDETVKIMVDVDTSFQKIEGFGGAFTQSSAHVWQSLSPQLRERVISAYFDQEAGLSYSLGRVYFSVACLLSRTV